MREAARRAVEKKGQDAALRALNLGCGERFHPQWVNLDLFPVSAAVQKWDLKNPLQFAGDSFDVVYHSHVLEHFPKKLARQVLAECLRVLKRGGILRVVVPDLEEVARLYLEAMEKAASGVAGWRENYDWVVMEMLDQAVRESPGGAWFEYLRQNPIPNWEFVARRVGAEAERARAAATRAGEAAPQSRAARMRAKWDYIVKNPGAVIRNKLARIVLSRADYDALQVGRFRRQGEIHQWMYDGYSLGRLLEEMGFVNALRFQETQSQIANWTQYGLDNEPDGSAYRPGSLCMEARKP